MAADADEPTDRLVVEVMDAADGETEEAVIDSLRHLYHNRGLKPGTENGPRLWAWFPIVVQDYFERIEARRDAAHPEGWDGWHERTETRLDRERYEAMTDALELPDAGIQ